MGSETHALSCTLLRSEHTESSLTSNTSPDTPLLLKTTHLENTRGNLRLFVALTEM